MSGPSAPHGVRGFFLGGDVGAVVSVLILKPCYVFTHRFQ
jgi:hypothetical protein